MGFTDKLAGMLKKKGVRTKEVIPFESLSSYIDEGISEEEEKLVEETEVAVEAVQKGMKELSRFLERLKEMEREEMFKRLDKIVRNSQKRFADSLKNVVTRVHLDPQGYQDVIVFHNEITDALQQMQKLNRMHGRSLYIAFDKEMKTFSKTVKEIAVYNQLLGKTLRSEGDVIEQFKIVREMLSDLEKTKDEMQRADRESTSIEESTNTLMKDIEQLNNKLTTLKSSEEYANATKSEQQYEALQSDLKSIEGEIYNILHPLDRDFRKFRRQVELGNFPFDVRLLERYEKLTEQFLKEKIGYPDLKKIAEKMLEALQKQVIKEKGHKKDKVTDILESVLNDGLIELQQKYHSVRKQLESKPPESDIVKRIESVKRDIEEKNHKIADLKAKKKDLILKKSDTEATFEKIQDEIREKCDEIGLQVE